MESVMPSNNLTFCRPLLLPPSVFPSIRVFSSESVLSIRKPVGASVQHQSFQWKGIQIIQFSHSVVPDSLWPRGLQHARLPCPSPTLGTYSNSCPLSQWCHPTISSSVVPFSSCLQSFPASGSFQMSQFFESTFGRCGPAGPWTPFTWGSHQRSGAWGPEHAVLSAARVVSPGLPHMRQLFHT